jgi:hypothetical protein
MTYRYLYLAFALSACSNSSSETIDAACTHQAQARCSQLMTCSAADFERRFPDLATCEAREKLQCTDGLSAPHTAVDTKTADACTTALAAESCMSFVYDVSPPAQCNPQSGPTADGAACAFSSQCRSTFCAVASTSLCGTCQEPPTAGTSCANNGCGPAMVCVASTMQCQVPGAASAACSAQLPCATGLACVGATTTAMGTCMQQVATADLACDNTLKTAPDCDPSAGLTCNTMTKTCVQQPIVAAGQPCGLVNNVPTACAGGARCFGAAGAKMCVAPAADGAACDTMVGPDCIAPARCVTGGTGTAGTCLLPGSQSC